MEKTTIKMINLPSISSCEKRCDQEKSCKSVTYCNKGTNENKCYLSSLELNEAYPQDPFDDDCISSFDPCFKGYDTINVFMTKWLKNMHLITVTLQFKYLIHFRYDMD